MIQKWRLLDTFIYTVMYQPRIYLRQVGKIQTCQTWFGCIKTYLGMEEII